MNNRKYAPMWNIRKSILIGTQESTNPTRTMARRTHKICKEIGEISIYYFWMVERLNKKNTDSTAFYIEEAARECGVTDRTIKRWNLWLKDHKWINIEYRKYMGRNTYARYTLLPINDLIHDNGLQKEEPKEVSQRGDTDVTARGDTDVTAKLSLSSMQQGVMHSVSRSKTSGSGSREETASAALTGGTAGLSSLLLEELVPHVEDVIATWIGEGLPAIQDDNKTVEDIIQSLGEYIKAGARIEDIKKDLRYISYLLPLPECEIRNFALKNQKIHSAGWLFIPVDGVPRYKIMKKYFKNGVLPAAVNPNDIKVGDNIRFLPDTPYCSFRGIYSVVVIKGDSILVQLDDGGTISVASRTVEVVQNGY